MTELATILADIFETDESGDVDTIIAAIRVMVPTITTAEFLRAMDEYEAGIGAGD